MSSATNISAMFSRNNSFNQPIANWERTSPDVSTLVNNTTLNNTFSSGRQSWSFNQPIGNWNVSNVTDLTACFYRSVFDQDLSNWDVRKVTTASSFGTKGAPSGGIYFPFSATNIDAIYNGWSALSGLEIGVVLQFSVASTGAGATGKAILEGSPNNWTIAENIG